MAEKESKVLFNSFQTPNIYVDEAMYLLTSDEYKVLSFIDRHILGWKDRMMERRAPISLTMIVEGYKSKRTGYVFHGTGLSRPTANKCLDSLTYYGFIEPDGEPTPDGQVWAVCDFPKFDLLLERLTAKRAANSKRMANVRKDNAGKSHLPVNGINQGGLIAFTDAGKSHLRKQRHTQRQEKEKELPISAATQSDNAVASLANEADDDAMFPASSKGSAKTKSARADKAQKRLAQQTIPPTPLTPAGDADAETPAPAGPRKPAMLTIIAWNWNKNEGFAKGLIGQLMGTAKKGERGAFKITPAMTHEEIMGYGAWYRRKHPLAKGLPPKAEWLHESVEEFRAEDDYAQWIEQGADDLLRFMTPDDDTPATPEAEKVVLPREDADAAMQAIYSRLKPANMLEENS